MAAEQTAPWNKDWSSFAAPVTAPPPAAPAPQGQAQPQGDGMPWQKDWGSFAAAPPAPVGTAEDVGRAALSGAATGLAGVPGAPGDIARKVEDTGINVWLIRKAHELLPDNSTVGKAFWGAGPQRTLSDVVAGRPGSYPIAGSMGGDTFGIGLPTTAEIKHATALDKTDYEPVTEVGKFAKPIAEGVTGAALTGGIGGGVRATAGNLARYGALPGAASEAAGELAHKYAPAIPEVETAARVISGLGAPALGPRIVTPFAAEAE